MEKMIQAIGLCFFCLLGTWEAASASRVYSSQKIQQYFDVYDFGAAGDGTTSDTEAIQAAIDTCHAKGGGKVYFHQGKFISGTIYLKSNVTLYVESGAILKASDNLDHFPITSSNYASIEGTYVTNKMLIYAEDAKNIGIEGRGTIDGNGDHWANVPSGKPSFTVKPRIVHFRGCEKIVIADITFTNSASWVQSYQNCTDILIDGVNVESRPNGDINKERFSVVKDRNNDGLDITDCEHVRITNCRINSDDDAIALKSFSPNSATRNVLITNCLLSSNSSAIKIGTESAGGFSDIIISNCIVYDTRNDAIALLSADGAFLERITVSNISLRKIKGAAIVIVLGDRNRTYRTDAVSKTPHTKDILIDNIFGSSISSFGCSITGIKTAPVEGVVISNIRLSFEGGEIAEASHRKIPENNDTYPSGRKYGVPPSYGFFVRNVKDITFENIHLDFVEPDARPAMVFEDIEQLKLTNITAASTESTPELIRLVNAQDVKLVQCKPLNNVSIFLSIKGEKSNNIFLLNNFLKKAGRLYSTGAEVSKTAVKESGTFN